MFKLIVFIVIPWSNAFGMNSSSIACKMAYYFGYLPNEMNTWVVLWSGIDRYISVIYPRRYKFRDALKFQIFMILIFLCFGMLINIPYPLEVDLVSNYCQVKLFEMAFYQSISVTLLSTFLPGILMIVFTLLIFQKLVDQKKRLKHNPKKEFSFLKSLVTIYSLYLVCHMPYCISAIVFYITSKQFVGTLLYQTTNYLTNFYTAFDFFTYFFSNKIFRNHAISLFCGSKIVKHENIRRADKIKNVIRNAQ